MEDIENMEAGLTRLKLPDTDSKLAWIGRLIKLSLWKYETNGAAPSPLLFALGN